MDKEIRVRQSMLKSRQGDGSYLVDNVGKVFISEELRERAKSFNVPIAFRCMNASGLADPMPIYQAVGILPTGEEIQPVIIPNMKSEVQVDHKPSLFVASSIGSLDAAYAIQDNLDHDAEVTVWPQGVFDLSRSTLESLMTIIDKMDFGVFGPDDVLTKDKVEHTVVRDNVILELGLFIGKMGRDRNFIVMPNQIDNFHLPTDLIGVNPAKYNAHRSDHNLQAALGPACNEIRKAIRKIGNNTPAEIPNATTSAQSAPAHVPLPTLTSPLSAKERVRNYVSKRVEAAELLNLETLNISLLDIENEEELKSGDAKRIAQAMGFKWRWRLDNAYIRFDLRELDDAPTPETNLAELHNASAKHNARLKIFLSTWVGNPSNKTFTYSKVDEDYDLPNGTAQQLLPEIARSMDLRIVHDPNSDALKLRAELMN